MRKIDLENTKLLLSEVRLVLDTYEKGLPEVPLELFEKMDPIIRDSFFAQLSGFPWLDRQLHKCANHLAHLIDVEESCLR